MDIKLTKQIVELTDEKNYLRNLIEASEETGRDIETVILDKIEYIYDKIAALEAEMNENEGGE